MTLTQTKPEKLAFPSDMILVQLYVATGNKVKKLTFITYLLSFFYLISLSHQFFFFWTG